MASRKSLPVALLVAALTLLAWWNRFVQDDAFISFRYAKNLIEGAGLVWNPGERVEGYTNFLWTLLIAAGMAAGAEPVILTQALGLVLFACSLWLVRLVALAAGLAEPAALSALILTGANFTFSSYATGGLETPLVVALFLGGCLAGLRTLTGEWTRRRGLSTLSVLVCAAFLTRMDSAVLLAGPALTALVGGPADQSASRRGLAADVLRLAALPAAVGAAWLAWKYSYYGDLFPRSFYLKAVNAATFDRGFRYFYAFIDSYLLAPFLLLAIFRFGTLFLKEHRSALMMAATVSLWFGYVMKIGGDFMEFRLMAPVIPLMTILLVWMLFGWAHAGWGRRAVLLRLGGAVLVLGGSLHHAMTFSYDRETGVEPIGMLARHLDAPDENWTGIGKALAAAFDPADGITIAVTAAGAIPYYSGLRAVDMLGLNEPVEGGAEAGAVAVSEAAGHRRVLTYESLNRRGTHLVISHPVVVREGTAPPALPLLPVTGPPHLRAKVIMLPIGGGYEVVMLSIHPLAPVDSAAVRRGWAARTVTF